MRPPSTRAVPNATAAVTFFVSLSQVHELLQPQGAGMICPNAAAQPGFYLDPAYTVSACSQLRLPADAVEVSCRGRWDLHSELESATLDLAEVRPFSNVAGHVTAAIPRLCSFFIHCSLGIELAAIRRVDRLFVPKVEAKPADMEAIARNLAYEECGVSISTSMRCEWNCSAVLQLAYTNTAGNICANM